VFYSVLWKHKYQLPVILD